MLKTFQIGDPRTQYPSGYAHRLLNSDVVLLLPFADSYEVSSSQALFVPPSFRRRDGRLRVQQ